MQENNVSIVREIGKGELRLADAAAAVAGTAPAEFDPRARGAVAGLVWAWLGADPGSITQKTSAGERTHFGVGFDALVSKVKRDMSAPDGKVTLRVTLSGENGGSTTVAPDHELYAALVALVSGE